MLQQQLGHPRWYVALRRVVVSIAVLSFLPIALLPLHLFEHDEELATVLLVLVTCCTLLLGGSLEAAMRIHRYVCLQRAMARRSVAT